MNKNQKTKEKTCAFYASDYHFEMISLPYINKKLDESKEVIVLTENNLKETIKKLKDMNITVHMFTGDTKEKAEEISKELNIEDVSRKTAFARIRSLRSSSAMVTFRTSKLNSRPVARTRFECMPQASGILSWATPNTATMHLTKR